VSAYVGRDAVSDEAIREMLREWRQPAAEGRASTVPAKRLRFAEAGRTLAAAQKAAEKLNRGMSNGWSARIYNAAGERVDC